MTTYEDIDFDFITDSSGSFENLLERLDMKKEDATTMALTYFALYVSGAYEGGRILVMVNPEGDSAWPMDDEVTEAHIRDGIISISVEKESMNKLTRCARKDDPTDTMTCAFILLEKICDLRDAGWGMGLLDQKSNELIPISLKIQTIEPPAEVIDKVVQAIAPPKPGLH